MPSAFPAEGEDTPSTLSTIHHAHRNLTPTNANSDEVTRRQSQHSAIAKAVLSKPIAMATVYEDTTIQTLQPDNTATPVIDIIPPTPSRTPKALVMTAEPRYQDGVGYPLSDTPLGSAPSTAPPSPRL